MTAQLPKSETAARALQMFDHIDDLIQKGSLKATPTSLANDQAESWVVYTNGISITVTKVRRAGTSPMPPHVHEVKSVIVVTAGGFDFNVGGQRKRVLQSETLLIPAGVLHHSTALEDDSRLVCVFMPREPVISRLFSKLFKPHV